MSVSFYYFSGTGYTKWLVATAVQKIKANGGVIKTCLDMATSELPNEEPDGAVGLMQREALSDLVVVVPVYFGGLPALAVKQMEKMPYVAARKVALWVVSAGYPAYAPSQAVSILKDRGYVVSDIQNFRMPDTFLPLKLSQEEWPRVSQKLQQAEKQIDYGLINLPKEEPVQIKKGFWVFLAMIFYYIMFFAGRHCLGMSLVATDKCEKCRWCVRNCPKGCISMKRGLPEWNVGCTMCFRCVNGCPYQAVDISWLSFVFGLLSAVICSGVLGVSFAFLGSAAMSLFSLLALPLGYFIGAWLFQFIYPKIKNYSKTCLLSSKKRVIVPEKDLLSLLKNDMMPPNNERNVE